jgi:hypothetical protein
LWLCAVVVVVVRVRACVRACQKRLFGSVGLGRTTNGLGRP